MCGIVREINGPMKAMRKYSSWFLSTVSLLLVCTEWDAGLA